MSSNPWMSSTAAFPRCGKRTGSIPGGLAEEVTLQVALETRVVSLAGEQELQWVQESGAQSSGPT